MKQTFHFKNDKSDKFWMIDHAGNDLMVNYGRTGSIGKFQIKEFDSPEACEKEAKKLITSKLKEGYAAWEDFDYNGHLYFDDEETGLHRLTSHPLFSEKFSDEIYYDCGDEEAPFGSDEGSDTLASLSGELRKNRNLDFKTFPKKLIEADWDMEYVQVDSLEPEAVKALLKDKETDAGVVTQSDMVTYATAFAQIKITGRLDP